MERELILWPVAGHLVLLLFLYAWLSLVRKQIRDGRDKTALEARISANLSNQYEAPLLFYAVVGLVWATDQVDMRYLMLAWLFLVGRALHTAVHTLTPRVIARGMVFTLNFLAIYAMWGLFLIDQLLAGSTP